MEDISFEAITDKDIVELTSIMRESFNLDSAVNLGNGVKNGPPGYDNGEFLNKWALHNASTSFKILRSYECIGGVILWITEKQINKLGCLFLKPELQGRGIGTDLWKCIENMYPETKIWYTETIGYSMSNHHFYVNKCGFNIIRIEEPFNKLKRQFIMEKKMK